MADSAEKMREAEIGRCYKIGHDGFVGTVIGHYTTIEGKEGVVLQQVGTRVVHVYGRKWIDEDAALSASGTKSDGETVRVKPLRWIRTEVFGHIKWRGWGAFGEAGSYTDDIMLTPEEIQTKRADIQADYERQILSAIEAPGPSDPIPSPDKVQHWAVEVRVDGVGILTIESECLSGIPNIDDYAVIVRRCAAHLNAFIGDEPNETAGGFPVAAAPYQAEETGVISGTRQDPQHGTPHGSGVTAGETAPIPSQPDEREAIARLLTAAKLLQQHAVGCATNHHGHDCELNGLPGWLADTKNNIDAAEDAILAMQAERRGAKP